MKSLRTYATRSGGVIGMLAIGLCGTAGAQDIEAIYTKIPTHPSSIVPGALDQNGNPVKTNFRAFHDLVGSPDGSYWLLRGRTQQGSDEENILLLGSGDSGTAIAQEGQPIPDGEPGEVYDFFGSALGRFNEHNDYAYSARARGGDNSIFQKVIRWTDGKPEIVTQMGDPYFGLVDNPPENSGNELVGNSKGSIHLLNDGTIGSLDPTIQNIWSLNRPAVFYNNEMFHQRNVTFVTSLDGQFDMLLGNLSSNSFYSTPDFDPKAESSDGGWLFIGRVDGSFGPFVLVVNDQIVIQQDEAIPGTDIIVDSIFNANIAANGDWYARGRDVNDDVWAVRNGELIATTDDPVPGGDTDERWGDSFSTFTGTRNGDWILVGRTNHPDPTKAEVIVVNGDVVVRRGDPVILPGDDPEWEDNVFIGRASDTASAFSPGHVFLSEENTLYFLANIVDADGEELNSDPSFGPPLAYLNLDLDVEPKPCPGDLTGDGTVGVPDLLILINSWGACDDCDDCPADLTGDCSVGVPDLLILINNWGEC